MEEGDKIVAVSPKDDIVEDNIDGMELIELEEAPSTEEDDLESHNLLSYIKEYLYRSFGQIAKII